MARYTPAVDPSTLSPSRSTEQRPPQFVGGSVDPTSGNLIPGSRQDAATGRTAAIEEDIPEPEQPTTRLAQVEAYEPPKTNYGELALQSALGIGTQAVGKALGGALSSAFSSPSKATDPSVNPLDTPGYGTGTGGATPLSTPAPWSSSIAEPSAAPGDPLSLAPAAPSAPAPSSPAPSASFEPYNPGGEGVGLSFAVGSVLCSHFTQQKKLSMKLYRAGALYVQRHVSAQTMRGYRAWAVPLVEIMQHGGRDAALVQVFIWPVVERVFGEIAFKTGLRKKGDIVGRAILWAGTPVCWLIGAVAQERDWQSLFAKRA
jgi:hypothetical protein